MERRRCTSLNSKGLPCQIWSVIGTDPPQCIFHVARFHKDDIPKPLTIEEERNGLIAEYRRLIRARKKSLETTRLILSLHMAIKELGGMPPSSVASKKDDPTWMKKFRQ